MKNTKEKQNKLNIPNWLAIILYIFISIGFSFLTIEFSIVDPEIIRAWWIEHPFIIFANAFFIFLLLIFLHGLSTKIQIPIGLSLLLIWAFSFSSKMKIENRKDPIVVADFVLVREALGIVMQGQFVSKEVVIYAVLGLVVTIVLFFLPLGSYRLNWKKRLTCLSLSVFLFFLSLEYIYSEESIISKKMPTRDKIELNKSLTFQDQGILYSLLTYRKVNKIEKPKPFLNNTVAEYKNQFKEKDVEIKPDIVMIMGEAWSDISRFENIQFHEGENPFYLLKEIEKNLLTQGYIYTPSFGGGTSNTEYDALTGNSTILLSSNSFSAYAAIRSPIQSFPRFLKEQGYTSYALHPGHDWFYNRKNVYKDLGFNTSEFFNDFQDPEIKGRFISEKATSDKFLNKVKSLQEKREPFFSFCVTIQNHSPYDKDKYGLDLNTFDFLEQLNKSEKVALETYFEGIRDMNREIVRTCRYLNESQRPTIFFYFGDHLPSIGEGFDTYRKIGMNIREGSYDGATDVFKVPYIFWANDAYLSLKSKENDYPNLMSANYIPTLLLESMGAHQGDAFYNYLYEMRKDMPVLHRYFYLNGGHDSFLPYSKMDQRRKNKFEIYKTWEYMRAK